MKLFRGMSSQGCIGFSGDTCGLLSLEAKVCCLRNQGMRAYISQDFFLKAKLHNSPHCLVVVAHSSSLLSTGHLPDGKRSTGMFCISVRGLPIEKQVAVHPEEGPHAWPQIEIFLRKNLPKRIFHVDIPPRQRRENQCKNIFLLASTCAS